MGRDESLRALQQRIADLKRDLDSARALLINVERHLEHAMKQLEMLLLQDG